MFQKAPEGVAGKRGLLCAGLRWGFCGDPQLLCRGSAGDGLRDGRGRSQLGQPLGSSVGAGRGGEKGRNSPTDTAAEQGDLNRQQRWDPHWDLCGQNPPWHRGKLGGGGRSREELPWTDPSIVL